MRKQDEEKLINLTENQAKFLKAVFIHERAMASGASGIAGRAKGKVAATLRDGGFITPMGRSGRQYKWEPTPTWQDNWDKFRKEISDILDRIA